MNIYVENINDIIHETSVDFVIRPCSREIHIVQYDKELPVIKVNLFREGQPYQLPNSALVHVRLGKLDNTFVYTNILGMNEDRTIAYFEVTEQMAMISGRVSPVIEVVYQGKVACSSPIPFVISKNPVQEGQIESHDEFPIIYQLESDVEEHNEWLRKYTALTEFDGFVEGESVWDGIAEGEIKYCQSGSQTEDVPSENTVIKIDLSQQHLSKAESKALYIKKIIINYTPDGQTEKTYEYTFNSRIFGSGTALPTIEPEYADLTDGNSGITLRWYLNYLLQEGVSQYFGNYNGTKGQQFGSNNNPPALISLSTSSLENCIVNSIYVEVSSNGGTQAKCKLTIVNDVWTCNNITDPQITSNNTQYKWLHEPNGTHLGSSSGGQVIHHYNHVFLKKENGKVTEVQPDPALQYVLNDYSSTYKYSTADNLLHQIGGDASFEVLSKIEVSYDSGKDVTYVTFPKNIMPEVMFNDSNNQYLYFDYKNKRILNYNGNDVLYNSEMTTIDGKLTIQLSGSWDFDPNYDFIQYDIYDGFDNPLRHSDLLVDNWEKYHPTGSGLPTPTKSGQVLVSNSDLEFENQDSTPLADNLTSNPEKNDALYSLGPTGGLADIYTGEEAYLQEVKGYSIVWNQLIDSTHGLTPKLGHYYIYWNGTIFDLKGPDWNGSVSPSSTAKVFDLTLMFGGNDNIPFSLDNYNEYESNGSVPAQLYRAVYGFQRLFSHIALLSAQYDPGTIQHVSVKKLSETGQNLWDVSTMDGDNGTGLLLLAGYRYEIYGSADSTSYKRSYDGVNFTDITMPSSYRKINAKGEMMWVLTVMRNTWVKSSDPSQPLVYIGFIHSGNHCLTDGGYNSTSYYKTNAVVPPFIKHEFNISGISNLKGIPDNSKNHCSVYDTVDTTSVKSVDLSTLNWTAGEGTFSAEISDIKADTTNLLATQYLGSEMSVSGTTITITTTVSPTGTLLYELAEPVATGVEPFKPIPLKDDQDNWIINDMGSEYFTGLLVCPVNQVSYYYQNLKDKLVNLKIPEIGYLEYSYKYRPLNAINIGDEKYRILPLGTVKHNNDISIGLYSSSTGSGSTKASIAIGVSSNAAGSSSIAIGYEVNCYTQANYSIAIGVSAICSRVGTISIGYAAQTPASNYAIAIGYSSYSNAENGIAIGYQSKNHIKDGVSFDGSSSNYRRTIHLYSIENIFIRNEDISDSKTNYDSYTSGHYLSEYVQNKELVRETGTNKYYLEWVDSSNYKTITKNVASGTDTVIDKKITGMHITVKVTGTAATPSHAVVGLDLLPYDSTNSYGFVSCGKVEVDGNIVDISATIDSDGVVNITAPTGCTIDKVYYNIR